MKTKVTILGAGNMGTALARVIGGNGYPVTLWNYAGDPEPLDQINRFHENKKYLPGISLPMNVRGEHDLKTALAAAGLVILAVPSSFVERQLEAAVPFLFSKAILLDVSKGLTGLFGNKKTPLSKAAQMWWNKRIIISGPAIALDIAKGGFTTMSIAGKKNSDVLFAQKIMTNQHMHFIPTNDVIGIKLAGALKNVYALLMGLADGAGVPLNSKAFLVVRAAEEMAFFIQTCGGKAKTAYELAGLGDLLVTGFSPISRNRRFGECLGQGRTRSEAEKIVGQVVEGIPAAEAVLAAARQHNIKLPLAELVHGVVWKGVQPSTVFEKILSKNYVQKKSRVR